MKTVMRKRCIIVGAGVAGLSAAVLLARISRDLDVEVWEASEETGGLLAPVSFCGMDCDRGSHRIHTQADPLLLELTSREQWYTRTRRGVLVLQGRHLDYPLQLVPFLRGLGWNTVVQMGLGFLLRPQSFRQYLSWERDRANPEEDDEGFEQFVVRRAGWAAYQQFYRPYVEKVWGEDPSLISRTVAKQRISTSLPWQRLWASLSFRNNKTPETFLYPRWGMVGLIRCLKQMAEELGVSIHCGRKVDAVALPTLDATAIFFGGHLSDLVPTCSLTHRGLYLVYLAFPEGSVEHHDTFYVPESDYWFGRVSQIAQFSPEFVVAGKQVLCLEIPEGRWGTGMNFLENPDVLREQLCSAGILKHRVPILDAHQHFLPRVYPLYRRGWLSQWQQAMQTLQAWPHVYPIGRQGLYLHCNIDHCVQISHHAVQSFLQHECSTHWLTQTHRYLDLRVRD